MYLNFPLPWELTYSQILRTGIFGAIILPTTPIAPEMGWNPGEWRGVGPLPVCSSNWAALWGLERHWPGGGRCEVGPDLTVHCRKLRAVDPFQGISFLICKMGIITPPPTPVSLLEGWIWFPAEGLFRTRPHGGPWGVENIILAPRNLTLQVSSPDRYTLFSLRTSQIFLQITSPLSSRSLS